MCLLYEAYYLLCSTWLYSPGDPEVHGTRRHLSSEELSQEEIGDTEEWRKDSNHIDRGENPNELK